jgi:hypothetical protein
MVTGSYDGTVIWKDGLEENEKIVFLHYFVPF